MERLVQTLTMVGASLHWRLQRILAALRQTGVVGGVVALCVVVTLAANIVRLRQLAELKRVSDALEMQPASPPTVARPGEAGIDRQLVAFEAQLVPYEDVAAVLQALIDQAQAHGLVLLKGEYQLEADTEGHFLRHRMTFPIKGKADVVPRFITAALTSQRALALEAVQFRRERANAPEVQAHVQLVLLVRPRDVRAGQLQARQTKLTSGTADEH